MSASFRAFSTGSAGVAAETMIMSEVSQWLPSLRTPASRQPMLPKAPAEIRLTPVVENHAPLFERFAILRAEVYGLMAPAAEAAPLDPEQHLQRRMRVYDDLLALSVDASCALLRTRISDESADRIDQIAQDAVFLAHYTRTGQAPYV